MVPNSTLHYQGSSIDTPDFETMNAAEDKVDAAYLRYRSRAYTAVKERTLAHPTYTIVGRNQHPHFPSLPDPNSG